MTKLLTNTSILAVASDKGGGGKTTTAINLASGLAEGVVQNIDSDSANPKMQKHVLLVDADHQANTTMCLLPERPETSLYESLLDESIPLPRIPIRENLDLVPASEKMFGIGFTLISRAVEASIKGQLSPDPRGILARLLAPVVDNYDYVIIDCPPSDNIMALNALFAASHVLIPTIPEPFCIQGVGNYISVIRRMDSEAHHPIQLAGILVTNYTTGAAGHALCERALRDWGRDSVFATRIRHSRPLYNANLAHTDIFNYAPGSNGAKDYAGLIEEFTLKLSIHED